MDSCKLCGETRFKKPAIFPDATQTAHLRSILRSNTEPLEISSFQNVIREGRAALARFDAEIRNLEKQLATLRRERESLAFHIAGCRSIFSPMRRMPAELLAMIFGLVPHEDECEFDYFSLPDKEAERLAQPHLLVLSQVSHRWHEIVMGTPQLWSAISVDASVWPDMDIEPAKLFRLFLAALRRSGNAPLRLKVTTGENKLTAGALLDAIIPHASRWREVYLDIRNGSYGLVDLPEGNLPLLDTLGLYLPKTVLHSFKDAPRLKTVELFGEPSKIPPMPWKQIRSFTYEGTQLSSPVLSWMQSLPAGCTTSLQIKQSHVGSVPLSPVSVAVKSVAIELGTWSNSFPIGPVLDALTLPGLRHFALTPWTSSSAFPSWSHAQYLRLAARSNFSSHLVSLHLRALITAGELIQTLTGLPLLETLRVADPGLRERRAAVITDPLLSTLTSSSSGGQNTSLPRLCAVHFDQSLLAFTDDILVNFVLSRRGTAANGRQFVVSISEATERERVILLTVRKLLKYELGVRFH